MALAPVICATVYGPSAGRAVMVLFNCSSLITPVAMEKLLCESAGTEGLNGIIGGC
jgi:hypothetical protein